MLDCCSIRGRADSRRGRPSRRDEALTPAHQASEGKQWKRTRSPSKSMSTEPEHAPRGPDPRLVPPAHRHLSRRRRDAAGDRLARRRRGDQGDAELEYPCFRHLCVLSSQVHTPELFTKSLPRSWNYWRAGAAQSRPTSERQSGRADQALSRYRGRATKASRKRRRQEGADGEGQGMGDRSATTPPRRFPISNMPRRLFQIAIVLGSVAIVAASPGCWASAAFSRDARLLLTLNGYFLLVPLGHAAAPVTH